ncbi:PadR family transcriptional regulator [Anaerotignum sp.]|nr:helix-turn-helix transcriptional regulator [Anaerotignum sp.]MBQ7758790.1 helix-turn-helix transcriptional regulator [Anaerotignum sp.]
MTIDKTLLSGSTATLILKLLDGQDMYGYQIIEELARRSDNTFQLKAGTLYPLLHGLEKKGLLESYEDNADSARVRKYYRLTNKGKKHLKEKTEEWKEYASAVSKVLEGGLACELF